MFGFRECTSEIGVLHYHCLVLLKKVLDVARAELLAYSCADPGLAFEVALLVDVYQVSGVFGRECMVEVSQTEGISCSWSISSICGRNQE